MKTETDTIHPDQIRELVREGYGSIAAAGGACCSAKPSCCGSAPAAAEELARHIGYPADDLAALPEGANMGLSCGNPNALAALQPGEVVLDLGAGGGFDVFIASGKVGPTGRAIGVDMTPGMLAKARKNLVAYREDTGLDNVEFRLGEIEHLPMADHSVDVVISNCVINLIPNKRMAFREAFRVLKPGGRLAVSDVVLLKELPEFVKSSTEAYIGCLAGAIMKDDYLDIIKSIGFRDVRVVAESRFHVESLISERSGCSTPTDPAITPEQQKKVADSVLSIKICAIKP